MSYQALYRTSRSATFDQVVGQEPIVRVLKNQVAQGRISHAYLFCGSRGIGKTSTARILAKAINCLDPQDGEPCCRCENCLAIAQERMVDVVEIDAASNRGVDDIRDLRERVRFRPVTGKYKVYIIDECHMLTPEAFNAFLKTLEEPPEYAVFILATTEPQKLPETILSRCQRFDFHRIRVKDIEKRLSQLAPDAEPEALETIARACEGGMRDAIGLLDRAMAYADGPVTAGIVRDILGSASEDFLFQMAQALLSGDTGASLTLFAQLMEEGRDPAAFLRDLIWHFRALMLTQACGACPDLLDVTPERAQRYLQQAKTAQEARVRRALNRMSALSGELRQAMQPRILVELALADICRTDAGADVEALKLRLDRLEAQIASGVAAPRASGAQEMRKAPLPAAERPAARAERPAEAKATEPPAEASAPDENGAPDAAAMWQQILKKIRPQNTGLFFNLRQSSRQTLEEGTFTVWFEEKDAVSREQMEKKIDLVRQAAQEVMGEGARVRAASEAPPKGEDVVSSAARLFGADKILIE